MPNDNAAVEQSDDKQLTVGSTSLDVVSRAEFDVQIATAHKYPRSIARFRDEVLAMATLNEAIAGECNYALPRKDKNGQTKMIEGASIRFAEIVGSAWGNAHVGTRVIADDGQFITAQAVFHDLERNWKVVEEVQRRVTDSKGRRYSADMIGVTANAARSIAMRNAVLHGIPKAFWEDLRLRARRVAVGDQRSLATKRLEAVKAFATYGVTEAQILTTLGRTGVEDVTIEDLETLFGMLTAIKDGDSTPESIFNPEPQSASATVTELNADIAAKRPAPKPTKPAPAIDHLTGEIGADRPPLNLDGDGSASQFTYAEVREAIERAAKAKNADKLAEAEDMVRGAPPQFHDELHTLAKDLRAAWR